MLLLQLVLFTVLVPDVDSDNDSPEPISFRTILTTSFYNRSWTENQGSIWLDELQTHGWDSKTGAFIFLRPWSKGNFSTEELVECGKSFHTFSVRFPLVFQDHVSQWELEYLFQVQMAKGCELYNREPSVGFMNIAYQESDLVSFQNMSWWPSPKGGRRAQQVCTLFSQYHVVNLRIQVNINNICPRFLLGLLDAGKADLQRQVRPEAWLSRGPSPGPGCLLLVCHVSGFYPKPVWVMWMRGEQKQQGAQQGDILPHTAGLSCQVRHSSLGGQDMVLYWKQHRPMGLVFLVVMVPLVLLAVSQATFMIFSMCSPLSLPSPFPVCP
uniref:Ig-like domain-containing protein n=1 Tax=Suricata suricatta TaxID=37032 RepID=A0A673TLV9_SURSU